MARDIRESHGGRAFVVKFIKCSLLKLLLNSCHDSVMKKSKKFKKMHGRRLLVLK